MRRRVLIARLRAARAWCAGAVLVSAAACGGSDSSGPDGPSAPRAWTAPEMLEESRLAYGARPMFDARGNVLLVWDDLDGKVNAKRYDARTQAWGKSQQLDPDNPEDSALPRFAIDREGNALALWQRQSQVDDMRSIWSARYDAASDRWGAATQIGNSELVLGPQLATDGAGNAVLAFTRAELGAAVMTAHFDAKSGTWSDAEPLVEGDELRAAAPMLAMTEGGRGLAVWSAGDLSASKIWAARYETKTKRWGDARAISESAELVVPGAVAINEAGDALTVWLHQNGERTQLLASRSRGGGERFDDPVRLDRGEQVNSPCIALADRGDALVIWEALDGERTEIWTNRYDASADAWEGAEVLDSGAFDALAPVAGIDGAGNVLVAWTRKEEAGSSPWARRFSAGTGAWSAPEPLDPDAHGQTEFLSVSVMKDGRALAVWSRDLSRIVVSHYR